MNSLDKVWGHALQELIGDGVQARGLTIPQGIVGTVKGDEILQAREEGRGRGTRRGKGLQSERVNDVREIRMERIRCIRGRSVRGPTPGSSEMGLSMRNSLLTNQWSKGVRSRRIP